MKVFGYTIPIVLLLLIAFYLGAKNPEIWPRIPLLGRL